MVLYDVFVKKKNIAGDNIRRLRIKAGLTQEELALKSGLSQGYVNQLESGKRKFTQKSLELIADALSVTMAELFREEGGKSAPAVAEKIERYRKRRPDKKEFLTLLKELPEHIVDHYFILLKLEKEIWEKKL
jgi:transcriptional regulator with XRE-family HTH domain